MEWQNGVPYTSFERLRMGEAQGRILSVSDFNDAMMLAMMTGYPATDREGMLFLAAQWACHQDDTRTFLVSESLCDALDKTDMSQSDTELIRFPFSMMYVDLAAMGLPTGDYFLNGTGTFEGVLFITTTEGGMADKIVTATVIRMKAQPALAYSIFDKKEAVRLLGEASNTSHHHFLQVVLKALLYINCANADICEQWLKPGLAAKMKASKGNRKREMRKQLEHFGKVQRVGSRFIRLPSTPTDSESQPTGRTVNVRFLVRGHFRSYRAERYTEQVRSRPPIWIAPFWKGPEVADRVHHDYVVREKSENGSASAENAGTM